MASFAIGVDLGGTNLRISAVDADGNLLEKLETGAQVSRGRDFVIQEMTEAIKSVSLRLRGKGDLAGVGIGVPGIIDQDTGMVRKSPNLPDWRDYPVKEEIERRLNAPVILENDANAAAVGEHWLGAARNVEDMCILTLGTGVGGGIVLHNQVWEGMTGMAGELGHITVHPDGPKCNCGNYGCVEQFASATAILRMAREAIATGNAKELSELSAGTGTFKNVEFTAKTIYNLALQGDEPSKTIFRKVGWALGIVLGDIVNAFNLQMYVLGGGVSNSWDAFAPAMFEEVRRRSMVYAATAPADVERAKGASAGVSYQPSPKSRQTIITRALLGGDGGLFGAARLPFLRARTITSQA
ncbi:MAG TPA: ROK family protein [Terriglobales bacterium]|nr:ROK family protein [Terriglobales bacterium]